MAETKRAREVRAEKEGLIQQMHQLNRQMKDACLSVPQRILRGPHQDAVAWKELAEKVLFDPRSGIPRNGTLKALRARLLQKLETLQRLS